MLCKGEADEVYAPSNASLALEERRTIDDALMFDFLRRWGVGARREYELRGLQWWV